MKGTRQVNEILFIDSAYNYSIFGVRVFIRPTSIFHLLLQNTTYLTATSFQDLP